MNNGNISKLDIIAMKNNIKSLMKEKGVSQEKIAKNYL